MDALHPPGAGVSPDELEELEEIVQDELPAYLEDLATLVNIDCGSYTKDGVDQVGALDGRVPRAARRAGRDPCPRDPGRHRSWARSAVGAGGPRVLLIGHLDTVFPEGTAGGPAVPDRGRPGPWARA